MIDDYIEDQIKLSKLVNLGEKQLRHSDIHGAMKTYGECKTVAERLHSWCWKNLPEE